MYRKELEIMDHMKTLGLIKYEDYPDVPKKLIDEFNEKLLGVAEKHSRITKTISKKEQFRQVTISNSIRVYNINLTKNQVEDEIYEYIDGEWNRLLASLNLPCPCNFDEYLKRLKEEKILPVSHEIFMEHFNRERLLADYEQRNLAHTAEYWIKDMGNGERIVHHTILLNKDYETGDIIAMCNAKDVTEQYEAEERLRRAKEAIAQSYGIIAGLSQEYHTLWTVDVNSHEMSLFRSTGRGTITDAIQMGIDLVKYELVMGNYIKEFVDDSDQVRVSREANFEKVMSRIEDGSVYTVNYIRKQADGEKSYHQMAFALCDILSDNVQFVIGFRDANSIILKEKEIENLRVLSETDQMTGLYNRVSGERKATEKIADGVQGMLCIVDIDKFKNINDTFGHSVGDKAIIGVADCLRRAFRGQDIVFRLGGDEFAVMAVNVYDEIVGERIIARFFANLDELDISELGDYRITSSVGAIIIKGNNSDMFEEYYKKADSCVYKSKSRNGNAITFYSED